MSIRRMHEEDAGGAAVSLACLVCRPLRRLDSCTADYESTDERRDTALIMDKPHRRGRHDSSRQVLRICLHWPSLVIVPYPWGALRTTRDIVPMCCVGLGTQRRPALRAGEGGGKTNGTGMQSTTLGQRNLDWIHRRESGLETLCAQRIAGRQQDLLCRSMLSWAKRVAVAGRPPRARASPNTHHFLSLAEAPAPHSFRLGFLCVFRFGPYAGFYAHFACLLLGKLPAGNLYSGPSSGPFVA